MLGRRECRTELQTILGDRVSYGLRRPLEHFGAPNRNPLVFPDMSTIKNAFNSATQLASPEAVASGPTSPAREHYLDINERSSIEPLNRHTREGGIQHSSTIDDDSGQGKRNFFVRRQRKKSCDNFIMDLADQGARLSQEILVVDRITQILHPPPPDEFPDEYSITLSPLRFVNGCLVGWDDDYDRSSKISFESLPITTDCRIAQSGVAESFVQQVEVREWESEY